MAFKHVSRWFGGAALAAAMVWSFSARAAVPPQLTEQGRLLKADGTPAQGDLSMVFTIYNAATGGKVLWTSSQMVAVDDGYFSWVLGSKKTLDPTIFDGTTLYLGVAVGGDPEMTPRQEIDSVPYAFMADTATNATHATTAGTATNATNATNATSATNATNATHATSADSAATATAVASTSVRIEKTNCAYFGSGTTEGVDCTCQVGEVAIGGGAYSGAPGYSLNASMNGAAFGGSSRIWRSTCVNASGTRVVCSQPFAVCLQVK